MASQRQFGRQLLLTIAATVLSGSSARTWVNLVDPTIFASAMKDPYRVEHILERDPFDYEDSVTAEEKVDTSPTMAPTRRDEMVLENGGCPMDQFLYRVRLHDRWGDGWQNVPIRILEMPNGKQNETIHEEFEGEHNATHVYSSETVLNKAAKLRQSRSPVIIFEDSMGRGYDGYSYVCLKADHCYQVAMDSGEWDNEIKWDVKSALRQKGVVTVAKGVAPAKCQFSIAEAASEKVCSNVCEAGDAEDGLLSADSVLPSDYPSMVPSSAPSIGVSAAPSDMPSLVPSSVASERLSDPPSFTPTGSV